jgi:hypothetical protein
MNTVGTESNRTEVLRIGVPVALVLLVGAATVIAKRQAPWIPTLYLATLVAAPIVLAVMFWWRDGSPRWRITGATAAAVLLVAMLPVPWMTVRSDNPPGTAWRLDGRVVLDGVTLDPPGRWYWLTVGRPPTVAEVVISWVRGSDEVIDMRDGPVISQPISSEPIAVAAGLAAAGQLRPIDDLDVTVGGRLASTPLGRWYRGLAVGRSHGLMVALVTYSHVSGDDLARGRTIAGTGAIEPDGQVVRVGGLLPKARAAARAGADVMVFPAEQIHELDGFDPGAMRLVPVSTLDEAIAALREVGPNAGVSAPSAPPTAARHWTHGLPPGG